MAATVYTSAAGTVSTAAGNANYDSTNYLNTASDAAWTNPTAGYTRNNADSDINKFRIKTFLENTAPYLVYDKFAMIESVPMNNSKTVSFKRMLDFKFNSPADYELKDGITPEGQSYELTRVDATLKQYGAFVQFTDQLEMTDQDAILAQIKKLLPMQAIRILDTVYRDVLLSTGNWFNAGGAANIGGNLAAISTTDLDAIVSFFEGRDVPKITSRVAGSTTIGSVGIDEAYICITHTDMRPKLYALNGFTQVKNYPNPSAAMPGEVGTYGNIRFICTSRSKVLEAGTVVTDPSGNAATTTEKVYQSIFLGADAYGCVSLAGQRTAQVIVKGTDSGGTENALNQRGSIGWKAMATAVILDPQRVIVYNHGIA